jgi:fluoride exporter
MSGLVWGGVALAGGLGAVLRFLVDGQVSNRVTGSAPYGTLVVNLSGAVLLGALAGLAVPPDVALVLGAGVIGAYTTFSTWMFETHRLIEERQSRLALLNIVVSVVAGVCAAAVGVWIGGRL